MSISERGLNVRKIWYERCIMNALFRVVDIDNGPLIIAGRYPFASSIEQSFTLISIVPQTQERFKKRDTRCLMFLIK